MYLLGCDISKYTDSQSGTGERVTSDEFLADTQFPTDPAHLVFKQQTQRLHQFQIHFLGQSTYIMVRFDSHTRNRKRFDHVGINSPLRQPFYIGQLTSLTIENIDKTFADNFPFLFRLGHPLQLFVKIILSIYAQDIAPHILVVGKDALKLVFPQQTVIDEDTGKVITDRLVKQHGSHSRIDTSRQSQYHFIVSQLRT